MLNMKHKRVWIIFVIFVFLAAVVVVFFLKRPVPRRENGIKQLSFVQGEKLQGYHVYDSQGAELDISEISDTPTLIVFAMAGCKDCRAEFPSYRILLTLFNNSKFKVAFVWDNEVPQADLDKLRIPPSASYSAKGLYKFTDWVPSYYFVDESDIITAQTKEIGDAVALLPDTSVTPESFQQLSGGLPLLVGIDGCGACKQAVEQMDREYGNYLYFLEGKEKVTEDAPKNVLVDPQKLISKAFGLKTYPVSIRLNEAGTIVVEEK